MKYLSSILILFVFYNCTIQETPTCLSSLKDNEHLYLNGFNILTDSVEINDLQSNIGEADSIIFEDGAKEEFGFDIVDLYYGKSYVTILNNYISEVIIRDNRLSFNNIKIGDNIGKVNTEIYSKSSIEEQELIIYLFDDTDDLLIFEFDTNNLISKISFYAPSYF